MWLARSPLVDEGVVVRPDQVSLGVLVSAVPRDLVDEAVAVCGVREKRADAKLPAHVHLPGLGEGERHSFAVRRANLRHFDQRSGERIEQR